jgi:hypothetical protein
MTKKLLNESWLKMFGEWNKELLKYIYGKDVKMHAELGAHKALSNMIKEDEEESIDNTLKFSIVGEEGDLKSYANALMAQKNYLDVYVMHGAEHMQTKKHKEILDQNINQFEQKTGITWPFTTEE